MTVTNIILTSEMAAVLQTVSIIIVTVCVVVLASEGRFKEANVCMVTNCVLYFMFSVYIYAFIFVHISSIICSVALP